MLLLEARLVVVGVDLGEPAVEEDEDHAPGAGGKVGLEEGRRRSAPDGSCPGLPGEEVGEGEAAHAHEARGGRGWRDRPGRGLRRIHGRPMTGTVMPRRRLLKDL